MTFKHVNNFDTALSTALSSGGTVANIPTADATILEGKAPSVADPIQLTLVSGVDMEIVQCTAANGTTGDITIVRQQEGTVSPATFAIGTEVSARITAAMLDAYAASSGGGGGGVNYMNQGNAALSNNITPAHGDIYYYETGPDGSGVDPQFTFDISGLTSYTEFSLMLYNPDVVYGDHMFTWVFTGLSGSDQILVPHLDNTGDWGAMDISNPFNIMVQQMIRMDFMYDPTWSTGDIQYTLFVRPIAQMF